MTPGSYTVRLNVDGQSYTQPLEVKPDPRPAAAALEGVDEGGGGNHH